MTTRNTLDHCSLHRDCFASKLYANRLHAATRRENEVLGVTCSKDLSFDSHIDAISKKVSSLGLHETCPLMLCLTGGNWQK